MHSEPVSQPRDKKKQNTDGSGCGLNLQAQVHLRTMAEVGGSLPDGCAGGKDKICGARKELTWRKQGYDLQNFMFIANQYVQIIL